VWALQPFAGFATYPTQHCVTGSLRHVYDFHGYPISEDMLLGLGRGLGFVYFHIGGSDPFYGDRANHASPTEEGMEKTAGRRTGVAVEAHATSSARKAENALRVLLERREPVLVYVDMVWLRMSVIPVIPVDRRWCCRGRAARCVCRPRCIRRRRLT
jgi:Butirosin biosynthesis protein H, N-terminal